MHVFSMLPLLSLELLLAEESLRLPDDELAELFADEADDRYEEFDEPLVDELCELVELAMLLALEELLEHVSTQHPSITRHEQFSLMPPQSIPVKGNEGAWQLGAELVLPFD